MNNLTRFDNNGIEIIINQVTGESFASQAGYSRMSGVSYNTIRKRVERLQGRDENVLIKAEIDTPGGIQEVTLLDEDLIAKWLPKIWV